MYPIIGEPANQRMMTKPDFKSLAQAVEAYYDELRRYVRQRTGSPTLADDVVNETWIRASTAAVAMPDNPRAYLFRMAGNIAIDHLRQSRTRRIAEQGVVQAPDGGDADLSALASADPSPHAALHAREELAILVEAVRELPPKCREVFLLYRGEGLTMAEIAVELNISPKTVEKHIARAMLHCRARLRAAGRAV